MNITATIFAADLIWWCPLQITVLTLLALGIDAVIGLRRPAAGALVVASALIAVVGLTAAAFSPWPSWVPAVERFTPRQIASAVEVPARFGGDRSSQLASPALSNDGGDDDTAEGGGPAATTAARVAPSASVLAQLWSAVAAHWRRILAVVYLGGAGLMAIRFGLGLATVRRYRQQSVPLRDRRLVGLLALVRGQLGESRSIEMRESGDLNTPATIGWQRPILLLPSHWTTWSDVECLAVLAHEVAHIRRGDFLSWVVAQAGVVLHFYHPFVHWLAARLRLNQELAADAAAARVVGGQRPYVTSLATMALRETAGPVAWPARAFLPTSKTFLRRIEMLHRSTALRSDMSRPLLFSAVAAVALAALCAAGLRGSAAEDKPSALGINLGGAGKEAKYSLAMADSPEKSRESMNHLKQLALAMHNYHDKHRHFPPAAVTGPDGKTPHSWRVELLPFLDQKDLYEQYRMNEPWDSPANRKVLEQMPDVLRCPFDDPQSTNSGYYVLAGPGTVFEGTEGIKISDITDGTSNTILIVQSKQNIPWTRPEDIAFDPKKQLPTLDGFVDGKIFVALADGSAHRFDTEKVKDQLKLLIMRNDTQVVDLSKFAAAQRPHAVAKKPALFQSSKLDQDKDNLKQLGLAMHNYHDRHNHFPPAVVMGPDGKTPHSWRVELLPELDEKQLFEQYQMNERWDSPANKKVLEQMPNVLRCPFDNPKSLNSGYYALVGPGTLFEGTKGVRIRDITDGTSNTIMLVEAKRNIPWTQPEDIAFDTAGPLPALGGFLDGMFAACMADGSVGILNVDLPKDKLKWLILRNDGHPIE
jgi:beta-lactamase regulating signal transducer with metallopeptidase domain